MVKLSSRRYQIVAGVCLILAFQASATRRLNIDEKTAALPGLHSVPMQLETRKASSEQFMDADTVAYLKPDEYILRTYVDQNQGSDINVFVAYFHSLQSKYGPHSPRICLPGAGWLASSSKIINIAVPGRTEGIPVNQFVMEKSDQRILVLYWYQNNRAVWAEEFYGKLRMLPDLVRYHKSDVSLVRLISPMRGLTPDAEVSQCVEFARHLYPLLADRFTAVQ